LRNTHSRLNLTSDLMAMKVKCWSKE